MGAQIHNFGNDMNFGPIYSKNFDQFRQICRGSLTDGKNLVASKDKPISKLMKKKSVNGTDPSQFMQTSLKCFSKKVVPICWAIAGMCWMVARRTRHLVSCAKFKILGRRDWDRSSTPTTWLTVVSLEIMLRRTSLSASLSNCKNIGSR